MHLTLTPYESKLRTTIRCYLTQAINSISLILDNDHMEANIIPTSMHVEQNDENLTTGLKANVYEKTNANNKITCEASRIGVILAAAISIKPRYRNKCHTVSFLSGILDDFKVFHNVIESATY